MCVGLGAFGLAGCGATETKAGVEATSPSEATDAIEEQDTAERSSYVPAAPWSRPTLP